MIACDNQYQNLLELLDRELGTVKFQSGQA